MSEKPTGSSLTDGPSLVITGPSPLDIKAIRERAEPYRVMSDTRGQLAADVAMLLDELARERSARIAAEEKANRYIRLHTEEESLRYREMACAVSAEDENKRLREACVAINEHLRTTFPPYPEGQSPWDLVRAALAPKAKPWADHALSSDDHNCRCGHPWPCPKAEPT